MNTWFALALLVFSSAAMSQETVKLELPAADQIERIEFTAGANVEWYDSVKLLSLLPAFRPVPGTYTTKAVPFQHGKFILKSGKSVAWVANSADSILVTDERGGQRREQLFTLIKELTAEGPKFKIWDAKGNDAWIDVGGNPAKPPARSNIGEYSEGLAPITVGDKYGFANEKGEIVIPPRWRVFSGLSRLDDASFHEGLAAVIDEMIVGYSDDTEYYRVKCGYINTKGEYVIPPAFRQSCGPFSGGLARIEVDFEDIASRVNGGSIGYIDHTGKWAIKPQFYQASGFKDGYALVQSEPYPTDYYVKMGTEGLVRNNVERRSLYLIDTTGKRADGVRDCRWRYTFTEGLVLAFTLENRLGFMDQQCRFAFLLPDGGNMSQYGRFSEGLVSACKKAAGNDFCGYLDRDGKTAIDFRFTRADAFSDGRAGVEFMENNEQVRAYINRQGDVVLKDPLGISPFQNGLALQYLHTWTISERPDGRNIRGYMNKDGKYVWLSPGAEVHLSKDWIKANYIGPDPIFRQIVTR